MKKLVVPGSVLVLLLVLVVGVLVVEAEDTAAVSQSICPVMGKPVNRDLYADVKGKRVYVCCQGCIKLVQKKPDKYIGILEEEGVVLEKPPKPQTVCPVMGGAINKEMYADVKGRRIYVCCPGCIPTIEKNPEKYIKKLEDDGVVLDRVTKPQTICPVMGNAINKDLYVDHDGKRIYVCCRGCIGLIEKNPEKYLNKLKHDGVEVEAVPGGDDGHEGHDHSGHEGHEGHDPSGHDDHEDHDDHDDHEGHDH